MKLRLFKDVDELERSALTLLTTRMRVTASPTHGVILPGGQTPQRLYRAMVQNPIKTSPALRILLSDERYVPADSTDSNYGRMKDMIQALGIADTHVLRVNTDLPLQEAANRYDTALRSYLRKGGRIKLGLLGLGADGHTASLFTANDIFRGHGRYAIAVKRPDGLGGISVTRDLLLEVEQIVFMSCGVEKGEAVHKLTTSPGSITAGMAVEDIPNVEVWYAP